MRRSLQQSRSCLPCVEAFWGVANSYDGALAIRPEHAESLNNRGIALQRLDRVDEALESYDRALAVRPDWAEALGNRACALQDLGRFDEALVYYDRALRVWPDYGQCQFNRALLLLLIGRFADGWEAYEWRRKASGWIPGNLATPEWTEGGSPSGKRSLFYSEQGLGDTIQFSRFACVVSTTAREVILEVSRRCGASEEPRRGKSNSQRRHAAGA